MTALYLSKYGPATLVAKFEFHPALVRAVKDVPGREYNEANRVWTIPLNPDNVLALKTELARLGHTLILAGGLREELNARWKAQRDAAAIRGRGDAELEFDFVTTPYAHQRAGLAFLSRLGAGALFWEMGLGKTKTAIDYAELLAGQQEEYQRAAQPLRVLVIAPNTVCRNWVAEIGKHAGHGDLVRLTGMSIAKRIQLLGTARYSIVNCEALSIKAFADAAKKVEWDLLIVDESTRFKNPKVARTKALHKLRRKHAIVLTGTPITGKPEDAWSQLELVAPGTFGKSYHQFEERYLHKDWYGHVDGLKPEMAEDLIKRIDRHSYRILKSEVLDLPPKVYATRTVTMDGEQKAAYAQMRDELRIELENMPNLTAFNVLTHMLRLTQITAGLVGSAGTYRWLENGAKVRELDDLLNDELAGEQVVVFGMYQRELEELAKRYAASLRPPAGSRRRSSTARRPSVTGQRWSSSSRPVIAGCCSRRSRRAASGST
jgi:SNF2 family DNA or RNA helicase